MLPIGTALGALKMHQVFIEFDGPQLFSCVDQDGRYFLAVHAPPTSHLDNWLYVQVSANRLIATALGAVDLHDAFAGPEGGKVHIVSFTDPSSASGAIVSSVLPAQIEKDWFPDPGERLAASSLPVFWESTGSNAPERLYSLAAPSPMWEIDVGLLEYMKSRRTPVAVAANRSARSVFDLVINAFDHKTNMAASTLGKILITAQSMVDSLAYSLPGSPKITGSRSGSRLDALAFFPSSFGVRLVTNTASLLTPPELTASLEKFMALISASADNGALRTLLAEIGPKAALRYRAFAKSLAQADADVLVELGVPGRETASIADVSRTQVSMLLKFLDHEVESAVDKFNFKGQLVGISLRRRFFRLEGEDRDVSGKIADELLASMVGKPVGHHYSATITSFTDINDATGEEHVRYVLTNLDELDREKK